MLLEVNCIIFAVSTELHAIAEAPKGAYVVFGIE